MKLISWNIWRGKHLDSVIKTLKEQSADIICLQEIKEQEDVNQAARIATELNLNHTFCKAFTTDINPPYYTLGNAILSKHELKHSQCIELSSKDAYQGNRYTEPRSAALAEINGMTIVSTHIGFPNEDGTMTETQKTQITTLLNMVNTKTIIAADVNSDLKSEAVLTLEAKLTNTDTANTPTIKEERDGETREERIDYIFTTEDIKASNFQIIDTKASDHTILSCEIE